jgi:response regulator RpfG family c-di-GMP phosphodiesterase
MSRETRRRNDPKYCVLVADDEPYIASTLAVLLNSEPDIEVLTANSMEAAQKLFAVRPIDLILTDPLIRCTPFELLEWAREEHPNTARLFMTGFWNPQELEAAINSGLLVGYLWKPWRCEELLSFVRENLINTPWIVEQAAVADGSQIMRMADIVVKEAICPDLKANSKEGVLREMVESLRASGHIKPGHEESIVKELGVM